jgi:hypothetical protein
MDQKPIETDHYVVSYRVKSQADGQPDRTEAFSTLNNVVGDEHWMLLSNQPHFYMLPMGGETVYLIKIFVEARALSPLKFHDIFKDEIRVIDERLAEQADFNTVLTDGKPPAS